MDNDDMRARLEALEARAPAGVAPSLPAGATRRPLAVPVALAGVLMVGSAVAGAAGAGLLAQASPGVQNPGQPLHGARLECMSPPEAARYLASHGFRDVVWQVEAGVAGRKGGSSTQVADPPQHGFVVPGSILGDGRLYMVIDQRDGTTGTGACPDMRMP